MTEYRVQLGPFDVDIEGESHVDAAFAAAEWLKQRGRQGRFDALVYTTRRHGEEQEFETDLEDVVTISYDGLDEHADTQTLPEDNPRSHELFDAFKQILAEMKAHRSDDLIAAFHILATEIENTKFPEIIIDADGKWTCPHCGCDIEDDGAGWLELFDKSWDMASASFERVASDTGGDPHLNTWVDTPADWSSLYVEHDCGSAVSIPEFIHIEYS